MEVRVGFDVDSGLIHTAGAMASSVHDAKVFDTLIPHEDSGVYGDKANPSQTKRQAAKRVGVLWAIKENGAARV